MENLCAIREINKAIIAYEEEFQQHFSLSLNEAMLLCTLQGGAQSSGEIADRLGLSCSNTSKVIKSVEEKELITRLLGKEDKRQMFFSLTHTGKEKIKTIHCQEIPLPNLLQIPLNQNKKS